MGKDTKISWCDHSWNPFWGCTKVSEGCRFCYAEGLATRYNTQWGPQGERRMMSDSTWREPMWWHRSALKEGKRRRVFCASMADVFEKNPQVTAARERLWGLIQESTALDWLLLTKRPENIIEMIPQAWLDNPPANVWYGTSVENQEMADKRIPELVKVPATVRFLSAEPLLGSINLSAHFAPGLIHWVITGGESGNKARPASIDWFREIRLDAERHNVAFFHKQNGGRDKAKGGDRLGDTVIHQMPQHFGYGLPETQTTLTVEAPLLL